MIPAPDESTALSALTGPTRSSVNAMIGAISVPGNPFAVSSAGIPGGDVVYFTPFTTQETLLTFPLESLPRTISYVPTGRFPAVGTPEPNGVVYSLFGKMMTLLKL